jgi:hypothetical protein
LKLKTEASCSSVAEVLVEKTFGENSWTKELWLDDGVQKNCLKWG